MSAESLPILPSVAAHTSTVPTMAETEVPVSHLDESKNAEIEVPETHVLAIASHVGAL